MFRKLFLDEGGFIVSAELVLIATICVIGLIVGLSEIQHAINCELNDVAEAIGCLNQSFCFSGFTKIDCCRVHARTFGSVFVDVSDNCDNNQCDISCDHPVPETPRNCAGGYW
jgi:hypothetical protein